LTGSLAPAELLTGAAVALLAALLARPHLTLLAGLRLRPLFPWYLLRYFATFIVALLIANLDMARRLLSPSLPLRPAVVEVATELESELGRLLLANSITLTPGTLTVDIVGDRLLVHWIAVPPESDLEAVTRGVAAPFERRLREWVR